MTLALLLTIAYLALLLRLALWVGELLREASGCLCRKGAWHPDCPVHGRRA
jgi:hypothetical protein